MPESPPVRQPSAAAIDEAVAVLRRGGLVAIPTETVYGLAADASDPDAVGRIFDVKGRPRGHPLIVHLPGADHLERWARSVPPAARVLAEAIWPGPLTLILERAEHVPDAVTGGRSTVGLRVPDHRVALDLLERFGGGLAAPSANRFGRVSPTRAEHVVADLGAAVDLVLDGGPCRVGVESTIVEVTAAHVAVLRSGAVTSEQIEALTGARVRTDVGGPARAPGMLASHYAPKARVLVAEDAAAAIGELVEQGRRVAVLAQSPPPDLPAAVVVLDPVGDVAGYARHLYDRLRRADELDVDVVVAVPPPAVGAGVAVRDRLARAAAAGT